MILAKKPELSEPKNAVFDSKTAIFTPNDQNKPSIEQKFGMRKMADSDFKFFFKNPKYP